MKGINPAWVFYIGIAIVIEQAIGQGAVSLTDVVPLAWIPYIKGWCALLAFIGTTIMTALSGYSSNARGPLVAMPNVPPAAKSAIAFLAILGGSILAAWLMLGPADAMAAQPSNAAYAAALKVKKRDKLKVAATVAPAPAASTPAAPAAGQLTTTQVQQNPLLLLQSFSTADLQNAITLANAQTPPDTIAATCYQNILNVVQNITPPSAPAGNVGVFTGVQIARDAKSTALNLLSPTGPLIGISNACAPLVLDAQNTLIGLGVVAGIVTNPVGGAAAVVGLPAALATFLAAIPKL